MSIKNLKILLVCLFIALVGLLITAYKINCDKNARRFYKQGMSFYSEKKYQDAYYNFKQVDRFAALYELSLIKQYQCAMNLADKKTAHLKISELIKYTKNPYVRPWALYNETELNHELNPDNSTQSIKKYKYIYDSYPDSDFALASEYKYAKLIQETNKALAHQKYIKYLKYASNGKYAADALDNLLKLGVITTKNEWEILGDAYYNNKQYTQALNCYLNGSFSATWYKASKCYRSLGDYSNEKSTILKGLDLRVSSVEEKDISQALDRLIKITKTDKIQVLQGLYNSYPSSYIIPTVTYKLAENSINVRAIKLYEYVTNSYPKSYWASNSLWEVFWYNYKFQRYKTCDALAKRHESIYPDSQDAPRVMYWHGRALIKDKKQQQARDIFYKIIDDYPLSYYAFLSARQLRFSKAKKMIVKKPIASYNTDSFKKRLFKDKVLLKLAQYNDYQTIEEFKIDDDLIKSWILFQKENYSQAIKIAKDSINEKASLLNSDDDETTKMKFNDWELKLAYPILYEDKINEYADRYKQSPYLFLSLIREESHFDKNAKSAAGAMGLTQLMKPTAEFIEKKEVSEAILYNPDDSIRIGMKYFDYLDNFFEKNEYLAILAYNAGPGNINKWIADPKIQADEIDIFVEDIPYIETKNYIKKILSSYWIYINIYSPKNKV